MKSKLWTITLMIGLLVMGATAAAIGADKDIQDHPLCKYCGMDREQFAHSRVLIQYDDGSVLAACSLHCAALDMALNLDKSPVSVKVGDYYTKTLIDAESAVWVVGGDKPGVMTRRAKWAFANKADAERYVKENGGKQASFDEAIKASYEDMYDDTRMIREKRKSKGMPKHDHKDHKHN